MNYQSSSVRRTVHPIQWRSGLYGSTRIEANIYCNRPATWPVNEMLSVAVEVMATPIRKRVFI